MLAELEEVVYPLNRRMGALGKQQLFVTALDSGGRGEIASPCSVSTEEEADAHEGKDKGLSLFVLSIHCIETMIQPQLEEDAHSIFRFTA